MRDTYPCISLPYAVWCLEWAWSLSQACEDVYGVCGLLTMGTMAHAWPQSIIPALQKLDTARLKNTTPSRPIYGLHIWIRIYWGCPSKPATNRQTSVFLSFRESVGLQPGRIIIHGAEGFWNDMLDPTVSRH